MKENAIKKIQDLVADKIRKPEVTLEDVLKTLSTKLVGQN